MDLMHLEKLRAARDNWAVEELTIPAQELCERYEALYTGAVNDVLREHLLLDQALPASILPLREEMKVAGIAFTIKSAPDPTVSGEMETRAKMLSVVPEHSVCIWETAGDNESAHWGEMMTASVKSRGARGAVIDGGVRDTKQVLAQNFPVFHRYRTSNGSLGRCKIVGYQVPIKIGKVIIRPGDLLFGDIDGVVVVPRNLAVPVLERAEQVRKNEKEIRGWIQDGLSAKDVVDKGGYF